ncbi:hypothetical protein LINPERHAP2_LOCUS40608 [Linum perenne]
MPARYSAFIHQLWMIVEARVPFVRIAFESWNHLYGIALLVYLFVDDVEVELIDVRRCKVDVNDGNGCYKIWEDHGAVYSGLVSLLISLSSDLCHGGCAHMAGHQ